MDRDKSPMFWVLTIVCGVIATVTSHVIISGISVEVTNRPKHDSPLMKTKETQQTDSDKETLFAVSYVGLVGKWRASYSLTINPTTGQVRGSYSYPKRPGVVYQLHGTFLDDKLILTEYTNGKISAHCNLSLDYESSCYNGQMENTDGRILNMIMCAE